MDFQDVSSYINSDISEIVSIRSHHTRFLRGILSADDISILSQRYFESAISTLGVPLLLPLTVSIEYGQENVSNGPTTRSLAISVDPISVLVSNEDIILTRAVIDGWTLTGKDTSKSQNIRNDFYDVTFNSERLGLGLRKDIDRIVVDNVSELKNHELIQTGDSLFAINGNEILDVASISLNELVKRMSLIPRPITITFFRPSQNRIDSNETALQQGSSIAEFGTIDKINVSIASAAITVVEREVPLLKVAISMTKLACNLTRAKGTAMRLEVSSGTRINYYNLRVWCWEPLIDPAVFYLSSSFHDSNHGPRELSIEIGDRGGGFSINITDSFIDTFSKLMDWRRDASQDANKPSNTNIFYCTERLNDEMNSGLTAERNISTNTATVVFRFAARQKIGISKPFVFRNRTGVSVAFTRTKASHISKDSDEQFRHVGEYTGLHQYESSDISVVSSNEDLNFQIDVNSFSDEMRSDGCVGRFPAFTVALQQTAGVVVKPFDNLETSRPGETVLPLIFEKNSPIDSHRWATWLVEQVDEKTVVTVGSSLRVVSMLSCTIEIGMGVKVDQSASSVDSNFTSLGILREGSHFNLPLWIAMQKQSWLFYVKLGVGFVFTPIFNVTPSGHIILSSMVGGCVECSRMSDDVGSSWLAVSTSSEKGISVICLDCTISIRNLLPVSIEWEIGQSEKHDVIASSTSTRSRSLRSGEVDDVLTNKFLSATLRLCLTGGGFSWSSWTSLSLPATREISNKSGHSLDEGDGNIQEDSYAIIYVNDVFHVSLPLGLRVSSKSSGIDVTIYSDLWCTNNCASLDVIFGSPIRYDNIPKMEPLKERTVGEATLQEIASLFDGGNLIRSFDSSSRDNVSDIIRISGQVCPHITEECFEYLEVERNELRSRWWASENPFSAREFLMGSDHDQCLWIDKTWVRTRFIVEVLQICAI
jgi:hypothetical protein